MRRSTLTLGLGALLLLLSLTSTAWAQGAGRIMDRDTDKSRVCGVGIYAYVHAWRDYQTGYVCEWYHDWGPVGESYSCGYRDIGVYTGHQCGYPGQHWYGYTEFSREYFHSMFIFWVKLRARAELP